MKDQQPLVLFYKYSCFKLVYLNVWLTKHCLTLPTKSQWPMAGMFVSKKSLSPNKYFILSKYDTTTT